ncbi:hypothetical protein [Flavobacterium sp. N1994]|uniref:hypothetical protein n=1 Tax=Flavobacterium sp. N1994 TaxID=2986827 RepID=UPI0022223183|nr:hypothetical protein [Flavobacterium sp. N1994]
MTIRKLIEQIEYLDENLQQNGFWETTQDNYNTIISNRQNIVLLKELTEKQMLKMSALYSSETPLFLKSILVPNGCQPFTETNFVQLFQDLLSSNVVDVNQYYNEITPIFNDLIAKITENIEKLENLKSIFKPYLDKDYSTLQTDENAIFSIKFNDEKTIGGLKNLAKEINKWNTSLLIYYGLIKGESPKDIELIEVDNGSIDFVININFDIASKFLELIKVGFEVFSAYLLYKTTVAQITKSYGDNQKLIDGEKQREEDLLENISIQVEKAIKRQLKEHKKGTKPQIEALDKKIEVIAKLVKEHIVKGNSVKLLSSPEAERENTALVQKDNQELTEKTKILFKQLGPEEQIKLLEAFVQETEESI